MIGSEKSPATTYHMIAKELLINLAINVLPSNQTTNLFLKKLLLLEYFFSRRLSTYKYILWLFRSNTKIWLLIDLQPAYNLKNVHFWA